MIKSVIFDIDGTLAHGNSWETTTAFLGGDVEQHKDLFRRSNDGGIKPEDAKAELFSMWNKRGNFDPRELQEHYMTTPLMDGAEEVIEKFKSKYKICLISGSNELYVEVIASRLGVEDYYANSKIIYKNGLVTDLIYDPAQAAVKWQNWQKYSQQTGYKPENCIAIGNGPNDLELFQKLKFGIAIGVNPEKYPKVYNATKYQFDQLSELLKIKELFG